MLSSQRAIAVRTYLIYKGVAATRFSTKGFGETRPIDTNDTSKGRRQNRRAEIFLLQ